MFYILYSPPQFKIKMKKKIDIASYQNERVETVIISLLSILAKATWTEMSCPPLTTS